MNTTSKFQHWLLCSWQTVAYLRILTIEADIGFENVVSIYWICPRFATAIKPIDVNQWRIIMMIPDHLKCGFLCNSP